MPPSSPAPPSARSRLGGRSSAADVPLALTEAALRHDWGLPLLPRPSTESAGGAAFSAAADVARAPASEAYASRFARRCAAARAPIARSEVLRKLLSAADFKVETMTRACNMANFSALAVKTKPRGAGRQAGGV